MVVVTRHRRYRKPLTGPSGLLGVTPVLICSRGRWRKALGEKEKKNAMNHGERGGMEKGKKLGRWPRALPQTIYLAGRNDQTFSPM